MKQTNLLREYIRILLEEEQSNNLDAKLEDTMDQAFGHMLNSLNDIKIDQEDEDEDLDEAAALAAAGIAMAAPQILKVIGELTDWIVTKIKKLMGDENEDTFGDKLVEISHKIHHKYTAPFKFAIKKLFPDETDEFHEQWAGRVFHLIVAVFLVASGAGAVSSFRLAAQEAGHISMGVLESAMTAVKGDEIWDFLHATGDHH